MKRFLVSSLAVKIAVAVALVVTVAYVVTHAAVPVGTGLSSPVMTNFNSRYFTITLASGTTPTNVIQLNLPMGPGSPDLPGDIINIVNGTNLWTNDFGNLRPRVVQTQLNATNIVSHQNLVSQGAFDITTTYSGNLVAGSNSVPVLNNSYILLSSDFAATDPTLRTIYLSGLASQGQLLFLENILGNGGTTTSAFQLTNGTVCYDNPGMTVALQNGSWASTNAGESLFLQFDGLTGWREVSRFFGPLGGSGNSLWTNDFGILHPKDLTLPVMITNQFQFGPGTTNVLYRSGSDLIYTNGTADVKFIVYNDSGSPTAGASLGATAGNAVLRTAGSATGVILRANTNQVMLSSDGFGPLTSLAELSGNLIRPWHTVTTSNLWIESYAELPGPTSWDRLSIYKAGTNSPAIFDIQTWGTGTNGANAGFSFRTNGVNVIGIDGGPSGEGELLFGLGGTNVFYRNGNNLIYATSNSVGSIPGYLGVTNLTGASMALFGSGGNLALVRGVSGVGLFDSLTGGREVRWWNNTLLPLQANTHLGVPPGDSGNLWGQVHASTNYNYGYRDITQTNDVRLRTSMTGTTGIFDIESQTNGISGPITGFSFRTNGVEVFNVTGTGGPSSGANWVASGTTNSTLAGTATMLKSIDAHNAKYWGAVGNGTANDTVSLQAGLNYVGTNGGGWFYIPSGTYAITNSLVITNAGVHVLGDGIGKTIIQEVDGTRPGVTVNGAAVIASLAIVAVTNCSISHLTVDQTSTTNLMNGLAIMPDGATYEGTISQNCQIDHCQVLGLPGHNYMIWSFRGENIRILDNLCDGGSTSTGSQEGIEVYGGNHVWVSRNIVTRIGGSGINSGGAVGQGAVSVDTIWVVDNSVSSSDIGIHFGTAWDSTNGVQNYVHGFFQNNNLHDLRIKGIDASTMSNTVMSSIEITGNLISNVVGAACSGIYLNNSGATNVSDITVSGNSLVCVTNTTTAGGVIELTGWPNTVISGNTILGGKYHGIYASTSTNLVITGNRIETSWASGIAVSTLLNSSITDNTCLLTDQGLGGQHIISLATSTNVVLHGNRFQWNPASAPEGVAVYAPAGNDKISIFANSLLYEPTRTDFYYNLGTNPQLGATNTFPISDTTLRYKSGTGLPVLATSPTVTSLVSTSSVEVTSAGGNTFIKNNSAGLGDHYWDNLGIGKPAHFRVSNAGAVDTEALTVLQTGKVGVLTNAPSEALEVAGNIKASGTNTATVFQSGTVPGISTTWTNMISGVITQRITTIGGIVVTNLTL